MLEEFNAFRRAEVVVALRLANANFLRVGDSVAVSVAKVFEPNRPFAIMAAASVSSYALD